MTDPQFPGHLLKTRMCPWVVSKATGSPLNQPAGLLSSQAADRSGPAALHPPPRKEFVFFPKQFLIKMHLGCFLFLFI